MVGFQIAAALVALLASVVVALKYSLAPLNSLHRIAGEPIELVFGIAERNTAF
jgi:hypothetical protein